MDNIDIIELSDLKCSGCGNFTLHALCREHGEQEDATLQHNKLRCIEWDYARGDECALVLEVCCDECGGNDIEGIEDGENV